MSELELALVHLGRQIEYPPTPDLSGAVRARLLESPRRWPALGRRPLAIALAVLAVAVGAVMAVPQTRAAILEFFHLRGVTIERVDELPTVPQQAELALGEPVAPDDPLAVPWNVVRPERLGEPDAVYHRPYPAGGGMVSFLYGTESEPRAIVTQFRASVEHAFIKKALADTRIEQVAVDGEPGFWLEGAPHFFTFVNADGMFQQESVRLAGNVLLWERGDLTLRLEADVSKEEALKIARSVS